jgi:hypothetical protein
MQVLRVTKSRLTLLEDRVILMFISAPMPARDWETR